MSKEWCFRIQLPNWCKFFVKQLYFRMIKKFHEKKDESYIFKYVIETSITINDIILQNAFPINKRSVHMKFNIS